MNLSKLTVLALTTTVLSLSILADANAASVSVKCETRSGRSRASVDASNLGVGTYYATVQSGGVVVKSKNAQTITLVGLRAGNDEVEFDFDSNRADINAGATAIARNFIKVGKLTGSLYNSSNTLIGSVSPTCRTR